MAKGGPKARRVASSSKTMPTAATMRSVCVGKPGRAESAV